MSAAARSNVPRDLAWNVVWAAFAVPVRAFVAFVAGITRRRRALFVLTWAGATGVWVAIAALEPS